MHRRLPLSLALPLLFLAAAGLLGLSLALGSVPISLSELVSVLTADAPSLETTVRELMCVLEGIDLSTAKTRRRMERIPAR